MLQNREQLIIELKSPGWESDAEYLVEGIVFRKVQPHGGTPAIYEGKLAE